jgi:hypothetical protein
MAHLTIEQQAALILIPLGFILINHYLLPFTFTDKTGQTFSAMCDFYHAGLDLYVEVKCSHLNGKSSQAAAALAFDNVEPYKRYGKNATFYQTRHQWHHSAPKQAIVQSAIGAAQLAIVFVQQPDAETVARIVKQGIQAHSLSLFAGMVALQLACQPVANTQRTT